MRTVIFTLGEVIRARKPKRLPVVMTQDEVKAVLANVSGDKWLMASLMYGAGIQLFNTSQFYRAHVRTDEFDEELLRIRFEMEALGDIMMELGEREGEE